MYSPLQKFKLRHPHRVVFIFQSVSGKFAWLAFRQDDGTRGLISGYSRKRDAVRALRQAGYRQHGSSWSLPSTTQETPPIHPEMLALQEMTLGTQALTEAVQKMFDPQE